MFNNHKSSMFFLANAMQAAADAATDAAPSSSEALPAGNSTAFELAEPGASAEQWADCQLLTVTVLRMF